MLNKKLFTPFENNMPDIPWSEYPRPQLVRESYLNLNGSWDFQIKNKNEIKYNGKILVPFCVESRLSGVERDVKKGDILIYQREFEIENGFLSDRTILHIGACDQYAKVFINENLVGENYGGYLPFSFDISEFIKEGKNSIRVEAVDNLDKTLPYGKQKVKRGGMWYTPVSGIWQTVWLESVPKNAITSIKAVCDNENVTLIIEGGEDKKVFSCDDKIIEFCGKTVTFSVENAVFWSPNNPKLYYFDIKSGNDKVSSYFALRDIKILGDKILINDMPYFFNGLLDQGYYSDGIYTPATPQGYEYDIKAMKECGFNTLRKHIKIEPQLFYYYCDKLGMFVFQDFVNSGGYNFLIDTALPTIGLKKGITHFASKKRKDNFILMNKKMLDNLYNHPSVIYYTIFNEGWGQFEADKMYTLFKSYDNTRVFDTTSGWFFTKKSDVKSEHIYFRKLKLKKDTRPLILSEFGGYSYKASDHSFNPDKTYSYRFFDDNQKFQQALFELYENEVKESVKNGLQGAIYTQVSDVEDETNGLLTYDRQVLKVDKHKMYNINQMLYRAFEESLN